MEDDHLLVQAGLKAAQMLRGGRQDWQAELFDQRMPSLLRLTGLISILARRKNVAKLCCAIMEHRVNSRRLLAMGFARSPRGEESA